MTTENYLQLKSLILHEKESRKNKNAFLSILGGILVILGILEYEFISSKPVLLKIVIVVSLIFLFIYSMTYDYTRKENKKLKILEEFRKADFDTAAKELGFLPK